MKVTKVSALLIIFAIFFTGVLSPALVKGDEETATSSRKHERVKVREVNGIPAPEAIQERLKAFREKKDEKEKLSALRVYGEELIERRINILQQQLERITAYSSLPAEEKEELMEKIREKIEALKELQNRIRSGEDLEELKERVRSIGKDHKVFRFVVPKTRLVAISGKLKAVQHRMEAVSEKVEKILERAKQNGLDTADLEDLLAEYEKYLSQAEENVEQVEELLESFQEEETNLKEIFGQAKEHVKSAHKNLTEARKVLREIITTLKTLKEQVKSTNQ